MQNPNKRERRKLSKAMKNYILFSVRSRGKEWKAITVDFNKRYPKAKLTSQRMSGLYDNSIDPVCKSEKWTKAEEIYLMKSMWEALLKNNGNTSGIFSQLKNERFPTRSRNDIKNKYYQKFKTFLRIYIKKRVRESHDEDMLGHIDQVVDLYNNARLPRSSHLYSIIKKEKRNSEQHMKTPEERLLSRRIAIQDPLSPKNRELMLDVRSCSMETQSHIRVNELQQQVTNMLPTTQMYNIGITNMLPTTQVFSNGITNMVYTPTIMVNGNTIPYVQPLYLNYPQFLCPYSYIP